MGGVMEVLDAAEDAREVEYPSDSSTSSSFSSSSDEGDSGGMKEELREYCKNRKDLRQRHRGLMQWKGLRNIAWAGREVRGCVREAGGRVMGRMGHAGVERRGKVETEV